MRKEYPKALIHGLVTGYISLAIASACVQIRPLQPGPHEARAITTPYTATPPPDANPRNPHSHELQQPPSLTADQIDKILESWNSPATGHGPNFYRLGKEYNIDPAYALAFFIVESGAGTNPHWAGLKPDGTTTHNIGNIICAGYPRCYNGFRDYESWEEGIEDWYRLIAVEYIQDKGHRTVADVIPVYAPSADGNNTIAYINDVQTLVAKWRRGIIP